MQLPDKKFYIRYRDCDSTNQEFQTFFQMDTAHNSAEDARWALSVNINLQVEKAFNDGIEDAFKPKK